MEARTHLEDKMDSSTEEEYGAFLNKVKRTVCIDNLSPQVTESILRNAIDQFGSVKSVEFIPYYMEMGNVPQSALVELESPTHAKQIKEVISGNPFMVFGMPRPVRARLAAPEMFEDRPREPGRKIKIRWLERNDPDFEVAQRIKRRVKEHAAEASVLLKELLEDEEKLAKQQKEALGANNGKYNTVDGVMVDRTIDRLARHYNLKNMAADD